MPFINKTLSKEIMNRTKLRNEFSKDRTGENKKIYLLQRNYFFTLAHNEKEYYGNLDEKKISGNRILGKTVKPFLSDEIVSREQIKLIENDKIILEESDDAQSLNTFFPTIVTSLKIPEYTDNYSASENITDPIINLF